MLEWGIAVVSISAAIAHTAWFNRAIVFFDHSFMEATMSISRKLYYSFLLLTVFLLVQFAVNFYFNQKKQDLVDSMVTEHEISSHLAALAIAAQKIRRFEKEYFIYVNNPPKRQHYFEEFIDAQHQINNLLQNLKSDFRHSAKKSQESQLLAWELSTQVYGKAMAQINQSVKQGRLQTVQDANAAIKSGKNKFRVVLEGSEQAIEEALRLSRSKAEMIRLINRQSLMVSALLLLFSVIIGLIMAKAVPASVVKPLQQLAQAADRISKGHINEPVNVTGSAEISNLAQSIERLQNATFNLIKRVQNLPK